jgi:aspartyl-tRNA(Asn)/glutamyl-tRNA(Gln) amidotransferase subunit A
MSTSTFSIAASTVTGIASAVASGEVTPSEVLEAVLERIDATEPKIQAWSQLDADIARKEAELLTAETKAGKLRGPLHGVPVAIKEEFHVAGMPTLPRGPGAQPEPVDSTVVAKLRQAGAIIVGKTHMPIAGAHPPTRNPWNLEHTPGASSSGSGAVVGARVVPLAVAEQTAGSALRPAAFCGVESVKPTYGRISRFGCFPFSWSLDTAGLIGLNMQDLALALSCVSGYDPLDPTSLADEPPPANLDLASVRPPRIGVVRNFFPERTLDYMNDAVDAGAKVLSNAGAEVHDFALPDDFDLTWKASKLVRGEIEAMHAPKKAASPPDPSKMTGVEFLPVTYFIQARRVRTWLINRLSAIFNDYDALLMASAPGEAPKGLASMGDPVLLEPWTFLGFPAIGLNGGLSPNGLPLGLQFVGGPREDYKLMQTGAWCERVLGTLPPPPLV